jgi:uncharacterized membrane protein YfcA
MNKLFISILVAICEFANGSVLTFNSTKLRSTLHSSHLRTALRESQISTKIDFVHVPLRDHSCDSNDDCGYHAKCDPEIKECATKRIGEDIKADILMCVLGFLVAAVSLAAGVGGGGLNVPLLMLVLSFDAHVATAMSQAMLSGGALAAFIYNFNSTHPCRPERPLINFELASLIGAAVLCGAQVGSVIHAMAPPAAILILLCLVLAQSTYKGIMNARKISEKEVSGLKTKYLEDDKDDEFSELVKERSYAARRNLFLFFCIVIGLIVTKNLFFRICSTWWWSMTAAAFVILGGFTYKIAKDLSQQQAVDEDDLDFSEIAFELAKYCVLSGVLAALCGIGGGMVIGPLLTAPDKRNPNRPTVPPPIAAATTATTLLVLATSTCCLYICRGTIPGRYALTLALCTFMGAGAGKIIIGRIIKRTGKESYIVWLLAGITVLSTLLMASQGIQTVMRDGWNSFHFRNFCRGIRAAVDPQEQLDQSIPHEQARALMLLF